MADDPFASSNQNGGAFGNDPFASGNDPFGSGEDPFATPPVDPFNGVSKKETQEITNLENLLTQSPIQTSEVKANLNIPVGLDRLRSYTGDCSGDSKIV